MIDFDVVKKYIERFEKEIASQPDDHMLDWVCQQVYDEWLKDLPINSAAELGAGNSPLLRILPVDFRVAISLGGENGAIVADMNTPPIKDDTVDLVIARHSLEHSLMPLIMLCEMARITRKYALVIVPICNEEWANYGNHYSVFPPVSLKALFKKAGLTLIKEEYNKPVYPTADTTVFEDRYLLEKI